LRKCSNILEAEKNGNNRQNRINRISLLNEFEGEILENERDINVPMITKNIKIESSVKKAFEHIMKPKLVKMKLSQMIYCK
jgi:hypothetical protein